MAQYLLIESRDPFENAAVAGDFELAAGLAASGHEVTVFLVQNGVLPARRESSTDVFDKVRGKGVEVLADDFSLKERGIGHDELHPDVRQAQLDVVVDRLAAGHKTIWC